MPYWYAAAAQPISSSAPRFAERKLRPATQAVMSRPAMKKSSEVLENRRRYRPMPRTMTKYSTMMRMSGNESEMRRPLWNASAAAMGAVIPSP
jgi:hypothetical protein